MKLMQSPKHLFRIVTLTALLSGHSGPALAQHDPDWPCIQRLVPRISIAQVWNGPTPDPAKWEDDTEINGLASKIAARRLPVDEAEILVEEYAEAQEPASLNDRLAALFSRTLEIINSDRASIIAGIKRFSERQQQLAERIRENRVAVNESDPASDDGRSLSETLHWDTRIFSEREKSLTYLCEQPVLLEQRAFALGSAVSRQLGN